MISRLVRKLALPLVLAGVLFVVPEGEVIPAETALVKVERVRAVDFGDRTIWILALGSDARPGQDVRRSRADAIQLIGFNTRTRSASIIGIPRDSWVSIPGHGRGKINSAMSSGGPGVMAAAVGNLVGVSPDFVFVSSFPGLSRTIDAIGGITVRSRFAFSDPNLQPGGFRRGPNRLSGPEAVDFARIRKSLPRGDFDRSANQQGVVRGIHRRILDRSGRPGFLDRGVLAVIQNLHTNMSPRELFRLAHAITLVAPNRVTSCVVSGGIGSVGGASVVFPNVSAARRYARDARPDGRIGRC